MAWRLDIYIHILLFECFFILHLLDNVMGSVWEWVVTFWFILHPLAIYEACTCIPYTVHYIYIICLPFIGDLAVYLSGRYKTLVYEHSNFNTFNGGLFLCCPRKAYLLSGETHDLLRRGARLVGKHRTLAFCEAMVSWHWLTGCRLQTPKPWKKTQFFMVCRKICRYMICVCVYICIYKSMHRYFIDWESYLYCSRSSCFRDWGPNKTCETSNFMNVSSQKLQRL